MAESAGDISLNRLEAIQNKRAFNWTLHFTRGAMGWSLPASYLSDHKSVITMGDTVLTDSTPTTRLIRKYLEKIQRNIHHYWWCDDVAVLQCVYKIVDGKRVKLAVLVPPDTYVPYKVFSPVSDTYVWTAKRVTSGPTFGDKLSSREYERLPHVRVDGGVFHEGSRRSADSKPFALGAVGTACSILGDQSGSGTYDDSLIIIPFDAAPSFRSQTFTVVDRYTAEYLDMLDKYAASHKNDRLAVRDQRFGEFDPHYAPSDRVKGFLGDGPGAVMPSFVTGALKTAQQRETAERDEVALRTAESRVGEANESRNTARTGISTHIGAASGGYGAGLDIESKRAWDELKELNVYPIPVGWKASTAATWRNQHHAIPVEYYVEVFERRCLQAYTGVQRLDMGNSRVTSGADIERSLLQASMSAIGNRTSGALTAIVAAFYCNDSVGLSNTLGLSVNDMSGRVMKHVSNHIRACAASDISEETVDAVTAWRARKTALGAFKFNANELPYARGLIDKKKPPKGVYGGEHDRDYDDARQPMALSETAASVVHVVDELCQVLMNRTANVVRGGEGLHTDETEESRHTAADHILALFKTELIEDFEFLRGLGIEAAGWFTDEIDDMINQQGARLTVTIPPWSFPIDLAVLRESALNHIISVSEYAHRARTEHGYSESSAITPQMLKDIAESLDAERKSRTAGHSLAGRPYAHDSHRKRSRATSAQDRTPSKRRRKQRTEPGGSDSEQYDSDADEE